MNSTQALLNLSALCDSRLPGRYAIEVEDVFLDPHRALADGIFMTPALVRIDPTPQRTIVGNLSRTPQLLAALDLADFAA